MLFSEKTNIFFNFHNVFFKIPWCISKQCVANVADQHRNHAITQSRKSNTAREANNNCTWVFHLHSTGSSTMTWPFFRPLWNREHLISEVLTNCGLSCVLQTQCETCFSMTSQKDSKATFSPLTSAKSHTSQICFVDFSITTSFLLANPGDRCAQTHI